MRRPGLGAERLVGLFLIGAIGLSPPILTLFNKPLLVGGVPLLYLFLFGLWILLVVLAVVVVVQLAPNDDAAAPRPPVAANERSAAGATEEGPPREGQR